MATEQQHTGSGDKDVETTGTLEGDLMASPEVISPQTGNGQPRLEFFDQHLSSPTTKDLLFEGDLQSDGSEKGESDSFVTLSPPLPRAKAKSEDDHEQQTDTVPPDLEGSTSSGDIPKSKLDPRQETKILDLESTVPSPGRKRNISPPVETEFTNDDLKISISSYEKHGSKSDFFITYKICTESTRATHLFDESTYEVWRRYSDFEWVREHLEKTHPTLIVPPLPGKQLSRYFDHMSEGFLKERMKALDKFLQRLALHPYFSFDKDLKVFITASAEDFSAHVTETAGGSRLMELVSSSVRNASTYLRLKNPDPDFARESKYFSNLAEKVSLVEKIASRLYSEREVLSETMDDVSTAYFNWALCENSLQQPLQRVAGCVGHCNTALKKLNESNAYSLIMTMKEYQLYCNSAQSALRRRDALQLEREKTAEDRERKKTLHDDAVTAGKPEQKLTKLAGDLQKAGLASERALDEMSKANEELRVDVEKWHEAKNKEMCQIMRHVADNHIDYHQKCFSEWEKILLMLKNLKGSPETEEGEDVLKDSVLDLKDLEETPSK